MTASKCEHFYEIWQYRGKKEGPRAHVGLMKLRPTSDPDPGIEIGKPERRQVDGEGHYTAVLAGRLHLRLGSKPVTFNWPVIGLGGFFGRSAILPPLSFGGTMHPSVKCSSITLQSPVLPFFSLLVRH